MGSVRSIHAGDMTATVTPSGSITRKQAEMGDGISAGESRTPPQSMSGWHHHGDHTIYFHVAQGRMRVEWGPGGKESAELSAGDFWTIPPNTVHREGNPGTEEQRLVGFFVGSGPVVVNVDGPEG